MRQYVLILFRNENSVSRPGNNIKMLLHFPTNKNEKKGSDVMWCAESTITITIDRNVWEEKLYI